MFLAWESYRLGTVKGLRALGAARIDAIVTALAYALAAFVAVLVYALIEAVILQPLPAKEAKRLALIREEFADAGDRAEWGMPNGRRVEALRESTHELDAVAAIVGMDRERIRVRDRLVSASLGTVTPNFFAVIGAPFVCGAGFSTTAGSPSRQDVAILSNRLAIERFGSAGNACGRTLAIGDREFHLVGVLDRMFRWSYQYDVDAWVPAKPGDLEQAAGVEAIGRRRRDSTFVRAAAEIERVGRRVVRELPTPGTRAVQTMFLADYEDVVVGDASRIAASLAALVPLILLTAIVNIASLQLARLARSERDEAVRRAVGEPWLCGIAEHVGESSVCAAAGLLTAVAAGAIASPFVGRLLPTALHRAIDMGFSVTGGVFAASVTLGLLFAATVPGGILTHRFYRRPAWTASNAAFRVTDRIQATVQWAGGIQSSVVLVSTALAFVAAAGVWHTKAARLGFNPSSVLLYSVAPQGNRYQGASGFADYSHRLTARVGLVRGVHGTAVATAVPLGGGVESRLSLRVRDGAPVVRVGWRAVTPGYFEVLQVPLLAGRPLSVGRGGVHVEAVVNQALATAIFSPVSPVGLDLEVVGAFAKRVLKSDRIRVVGVAGDTARLGLSPPSPEIYVPLLSTPVYSGTLLVRAGRSVAIAAEIERAIVDADPTQPWLRGDPTSFEAMVNDVLARPRLVAGATITVSCAVGMLALYGIWAIATLMAERAMKEVGIREMLGATRTVLAARLAWPLLRVLALGLGLGAIAMSWIGPAIVSRFQLSLAYSWEFLAAALVTVSVVSAAAMAPPLLRVIWRTPAEILREC